MSKNSREGEKKKEKKKKVSTNLHVVMHVVTVLVISAAPYAPEETFRPKRSNNNFLLSDQLFLLSTTVSSLHFYISIVVIDV